MIQLELLAPAPIVRKRSRRLAVVMVLGALLQFIKRLCILLVGLLRLSYRKVGLLAKPMSWVSRWECS